MCFLDLIDVYNFLFWQLKNIFFSCQPYVQVSCAEKELSSLAVLVLGCNVVNVFILNLFGLVVAPTKYSNTSGHVLESYVLPQFDLVMNFSGSNCTEKITPQAILVL